MGLFRFLAIFFLIYIIFRFFRSVLGYVFNKSAKPDSKEKYTETKKREKIFSKEEGEYVDYEDLD